MWTVTELQQATLCDVKSEFAGRFVASKHEIILAIGNTSSVAATVVCVVDRHHVALTPAGQHHTATQFNNQQVSADWMVDAISPHHHQYALATDKQMNRQIQGDCHCLKAWALCGRANNALILSNPHHQQQQQPVSTSCQQHGIIKAKSEVRGFVQHIVAKHL